MKFDFVIGNPPYQDNTLGENGTFAPPVYHLFMEAAYSVSDKVELIHPARFLFNAGSTPKAWNQKMLNDNHFKVLYFEQDSSKVFANTDIKGGIAITYCDNSKEFGAIKVFTPYEKLNRVLLKVKDEANFISFSDIVVTSYAYHFLEQMYIDYPKCRKSLSVGHEFDLKSNVFEKMPAVFYDAKPNDGHEYVRILGRLNNERCYKFISMKYVICIFTKYLCLVQLEQEKWENPLLNQ